MPSLKALRLRIKSVQSTRKITSAMKMISAAKLRKAHAEVQAAHPYAKEMHTMICDLVRARNPLEVPAPLLDGTGRDQTHLLIVMTSNRGLCGGFNTSIIRQTRQMIHSLQQKGKKVLLLVIGKKGQDQLYSEFKDIIYSKHLAMTQPRFFNAESIFEDVSALFDQGGFDVCTVIYNKFITALSQVVTKQQIIPAHFEAESPLAHSGESAAVYHYEPSQEAVLNNLLPKYLKVQIYVMLLESTTSEHGARMAAMDGATRNASDLIHTLNLKYNQTRQACITNELIEIISGAEAL